MYIFFSQSPSLSRPLLHTCISSILSETSEKITSLIRFTQSHLSILFLFLLFHSPLPGLFCLSPSVYFSSPHPYNFLSPDKHWSYYKKETNDQTALSRNQHFFSPKRPVLESSEPKLWWNPAIKVKQNEAFPPDVTPVCSAGFLSNWLGLWVVVHHWHVSPTFHIIHSVKKKESWWLSSCE